MMPKFTRICWVFESCRGAVLGVDFNSKRDISFEFQQFACLQYIASTDSRLHAMSWLFQVGNGPSSNGRARQLAYNSNLT